MYAKVELTRRTFKFWKWEMFVSEELFVGPFATRLHRDLAMRLIVGLSVKFLEDQRYLLITWKELEKLPANTTPTDLNDVMYVIFGFVEGL